MKDHLNGGRNSPHLFGQKNRTVFFGGNERAGFLKRTVPNTNVMEREASFHRSYDSSGALEQESISKPASQTRQIHEKAISFHGDFEDEDDTDQATIAEPKSGAIQEQGSRTILDQRIVKNRIYFECLDIAEEVLTIYIPPYQKPMRFLKTFADELFEMRTKESEDAYNDFLEDKIIELQLRNTRFSGYKLARLALEAGVDRVGGEEYGRP